MLKQELLDFVARLRKQASDAEMTIQSFSSSGLDWENITQVQFDIICELLPFEGFKPSQELLKSIEQQEGMSDAN